MLQKLENSYLAILRFVVILVAGILLVAVAIFGVNSLKGIKSEPASIEFTPKVSEQELITGLTAKSASVTNEAAVTNQAEKQSNPNVVYYERTATSIVSFVAKFNPEVTLDRSAIIDVVQSRAEHQDDPKLVSSYAKGLAESVEKTLANESVGKLVGTKTAVEVVQSALNIFDKEFKTQISKSIADQEKQERKYLTEKAEGMQSMYMAAGAFGSFLLIVFLSIIIKIERNLRPVGNKSSSVV